MAPMSEFDAGVLSANVAQLTAAVKDLTEKVEALEEQASFGKGALWGIVLVAGSLGAVTLWAVQKLFGVHT